MGKLNQVQVLSKHTGRVWNVCWHPRDAALASCGEDRTIRIWTRDLTGKWAQCCILTDGHQRTVRQIAWSPCGNLIASAGFDATTSIWDRKSGEFECNTTLEGHENEVKSVAWSRSGQMLATCSRDKSVWVWEVSDDDEYDCAAVLNAHTQDVKKVVFHPHSEILASASYDDTVKIFKEDPSDNDWTCIATLKSHTSTVWSLAFNAAGDHLATCSDDATVKIWREYQNQSAPNASSSASSAPATSAEFDNMSEPPLIIENHSTTDSTWRCVCTLSGYHSRAIYDISWCPKTDLIATASGDDTIRIFKRDADADADAPTFSCLNSPEKAHTQDVNGVAWSPSIPGLLASCSDDGDIKMWQFSE